MIYKNIQVRCYIFFCISVGTDKMGSERSVPAVIEQTQRINPIDTERNVCVSNGAEALQVSLLHLSGRSIFTMACRWQHIDESPVLEGLFSKQRSSS